MGRLEAHDRRVSDSHNLQRFVDAQDGIYETVLAELGRGSKQGHWMWFIFPQLRGLGLSPTAQRYGIASLEEARAAAANKMAVEMRIALARKEGYIDRVRETDAGAITTAVRNPMPGDFLDDVRDAMAQVDESTFDRMVGSMSQETLNKVLGKTDD